jgi:hypothetical protein
MSLNGNVGRSIREWVGAWPAEPDQAMLLRVQRFLGQWRSITLARNYVKLHGPRVYGGIFQGMEYVGESTEGALMPRLLGTYESELHPHLRAIAADGVDAVVDVGCAEGYYAVGLARMIPGATVHAHDIDEKARAACADLAARNGVAERVVVGGEFAPQDFERFAGLRTLVIMDAEGAELDILRPDLAPSLAGMTLIVETHDVHRPGALATVTARFAETHDIERVDARPKVFEPPPWFDGLTQLDQLIAVWEWRLQATPWLVMRPKAAR